MNQEQKDTFDQTSLVGQLFKAFTFITQVLTTYSKLKKVIKEQKAFVRSMYFFQKGVKMPCQHVRQGDKTNPLFLGVYNLGPRTPLRVGSI